MWIGWVTMSAEYGEVKDLEDKVKLYSNLMEEGHNAGIKDALVIREEAKKVMAEVKSDVRELVEEVIKLRKIFWGNK